MRGTAYSVIRLLRIADALVLALLLALMVQRDNVWQRYGALVVLLLVIPLSQYFLTRAGVYESHRLEGAKEIARNLLAGYLLTAIVTVGAMRLLAPAVSPGHLAAVFGVCFVMLLVSKTAVFGTLRTLRRRGFDRRNVLFIGSWDDAENCATSFGVHPEWGLHLQCVGDGAPASRQYFRYGTREAIGGDLEGLLKCEVVDEVVMPVGADELAAAFAESRRFETYGLLVRLVFEPLSAAAPTVEPFIGIHSIAVKAAHQNQRDIALKRAFDILLSSFALLVTLPAMAFIAVLIKLSSPGPVLFTQMRVGLNGRRFRMFKFRTMVDGAEFLVRFAHRSITNGPIFKDPQDYRVTAVGRLLRKSGLDELPQLWNVLRGDMSLVGPRPLPVYEAEQIAGEYRRRFSVQPGITCIWQVNGRSDVAFESWMKYDLQYVDDWSLWTDTKLLLQTIPAVFTGRGGY